MICGLILAGGASRRLGQPKALLLLDGETFVARFCRLMAPHCEQLWIVTGPHDPQIRAKEAQLVEKMILNVNHEAGQLSSLQCGLGRVPKDASVLFAPVDYAAVDSATLDAVFAVADEKNGSAAQVIKPRFQGQSGHPVLIRSAAAQALRAGGADDNAKQILRGFVPRYVDVIDPFCASDVDTMEDYERLLRAWSVVKCDSGHWSKTV